MEERAHHAVQGQSFFRRFLYWLDILDPTLLLSKEEDITNAHTLLQANGCRCQETSGDSKVQEAWRLSLASLHPDTGSLIPLLFRPPAFLPIGAPLVIATLLPYQGMKPLFFWQLLFQTYSAGFNLANGNGTNKPEKLQSKQRILLLASISFTTVVGTSPVYIMNRYGMNAPAMQTIFRKFVPAPLMAVLAAYNVAVTRMTEFEHGIEVVDKNGNVVGLSEKAGAKAVRETAVSRSLLFGATALVPIVLLQFLESTKFILRNPLALAPIRHISTVMAFGMMIPVTFSLFPQTGKIRREALEPKILSLTKEPELYYNRGI
ncbi:sideroflexin-4 [Ambystoma mexicanum]|uniref:sideroflexin-4 n=1 Tax=Ambystoma mexicanum TaxID=8296 RepID=UPI0037E7CB34